jgi:hypothetical protein
MPASAPTILATSMGFAGRGRGPCNWRPGPVVDLAIELAGSPERTWLGRLGTATGDDPTRLGAVEAVADQPGKAAYRVIGGADGAAVEICVEPRRLA